jgi:NADPH-dependent glutamate synthase beta subunit-like oxidoreductase
VSFPRSPHRTIRPQYLDRLPPCNAACPAGENIQAWLAEAQAGRYRAAWEVLVRDNPFPAIHGRVCYHPCEEHCNRKPIDDPVNIHAVERHIGDLAIEGGWRLAPPPAVSGKRVLIVGAGPSGLSAAWHLARLGHQVVVHEAASASGGMLRFAIPKYRLPREVLDAEVARIEAIGVEIVLNHKVNDLRAEQASGGFDAVFLAIGARRGKRADIPARDAARVYDALEFLHSVEFEEQPPHIGRRVVVYGGGNTAMDAARTATRLGASETVVIYRRTRAQMPAHGFEVDEAIDEGISLQWLRTITEVEGGSLTVEVMELDGTGYPRPTGRFERLDADSVILALGQETDSAFLHGFPDICCKKDGTVIVGPDLMTGHAGVFAGGDMVPFERTVATAVGHGKKAARHIDAWLRDCRASHSRDHAVAGSDLLHRWYTQAARRHDQPRIDLERRCATFDEVVQPLSSASVKYEAQRCLSCGNCFECDGCYAACPEQAVIKLGPGRRYAFDLDKCTGCGVCFEQCPCGAITMIPELVSR